MTIYDAIFVRKSIRNYKMETVSDQILTGIRKYYEEMPKLFMGIETELQVIEDVPRRSKVALFGVKAPYYLALYTEDKDRSMMNAGFIMEQLSLYLTCKGIGSCFMGTPIISRKYAWKDGKKLAILLAFGKPRGVAVRKPSEFKRLELNQICIFKEQPRQWMRQLLEVARLAPSALNTQPWRFLVYDSKIHIFSKKAGRGSTGRLKELNFGIMFSHMLLAAEELWLDLDLIRLDNISQKNFQNCEYILSAVMNS